ncbi:MAG: hypothetical protein J07HX64_02817 [halophilic archaeon J07HX64]|jgi:hypothetical protein|nr:MAG: hypothetical protein J07HX64_02817 [halophilic archaeon J07HX64]
MSAKNTVINWIAPQGTKSVLASLIGLVGAATVVGIPTVGGSLDSSIQTGALAAGAVLFFVGRVWDTHLRHSSGVIEERKKRIYYRASYVALIAVIVTCITLSFGLTENVITLSAMDAVSIVSMAALGTFFLAQWGYRWVM